MKMEPFFIKFIIYLKDLTRTIWILYSIMNINPKARYSSEVYKISSYFPSGDPGIPQK